MSVRSLKSGVVKRAVVLLLCSFVLQGCVVVAVADFVATTTVKAAGLVVDGVVGTAKAVGGVFVPSDKKDEKK
jgi:hypothetical protein